ncbi:hypothetical protein CTA1_3121 [Colletotrichum tanaceti]|uniref:Enoyl reductase (ER) domain-containing protein n=1 Tax=Colletotrichum tanaceti TaxID=1306861 RepID=A0A4U6XW19_9PEZI|nr:hypothetical protein CTA1_3121 [Colletotrichum tanaceti]
MALAAISGPDGRRKVRAFRLREVEFQAVTELGKNDKRLAQALAAEQGQQKTIILQAANPTELGTAVAKELAEDLRQHGIHPTVVKWDDLDPEASILLHKARVIYLVEVSATLISDLNEPVFLRLKGVVSGASDILRVTCPPPPPPPPPTRKRARTPESRFESRTALSWRPGPGDLAGLVGLLFRNQTTTRDGEFRVERLNKDGDDDDGTDDDDDDVLIAHCMHVVYDEELSNYVQENHDCKKIEMARVGGRHGKLRSSTVSRVKGAAASSSGSNKSETSPQPSRVSIKLDIAERAQLDTLHFVQDGEEQHLNDLADDEVEEGDRVVCLAISMHASVVRVKASACRLMPESMSFAEAASLPVIHCTAYNAFVRIVRLETETETDETPPGLRKTVLIHAGGVGLGQVAIQYDAQHFGLEVFATVGSADKRELVKKLYGIPDDR